MTLSKLRFSKFKRELFGELQLAKVFHFQTFRCKSKIRGLGAKLWLFYYFYFERNYDVLKLKSPCFLLNKIIKLNKNQMESNMENTTHSFREMNYVLQVA